MTFDAVFRKCFRLFLSIMIFMLSCNFFDYSMFANNMDFLRQYDNNGDLEKVFIDVPYLNQDRLVSGCESVSATMVLNFWGYNISYERFYDNYVLHKNWRYGRNGRIYAADPNAAYVGDARKKSGLNCGFGCYAPVIFRAINKVIDNNRHQVLNKTGMELPELCSNYINNGQPVIIYATIGMMSSRPTCKWVVSFVNEDSKLKAGDSFTWLAHEHCLVLTGYDNRSYFLNDPYRNRGKISVEKSLLDCRFREMGKQSLVVVPR